MQYIGTGGYELGTEAVEYFFILLFDSSGPQFVSSGTYSGLQSLAYAVIYAMNKVTAIRWNKYEIINWKT